ncbi:MAG: IS5 family transposase [Bacteroidota bacterium]
MKGSLPDERQGDLFRSRLDSILSLDHELCRLTNELDWDWLDEELSVYYSHEGRPSIPVRTIGGMLLLKQMFNESDESVLRRWVENPYWQYFTGETYFQHKPPFDPTDFVYFRKRVSEKGMEKVLSLTVRLHCGSEVEEEVLVDTTVQEKNITYPTDTKLALKIIDYCWSYAEAEGIQLRQSYRFVLKDLRMKCFNAHHPRRRKAALKAQRKIKTIAGRLVRDVRRKMTPQALDSYGSSLALFVKVLNQKRGDKNKRYSLHEPAVWCIAKGKAHKKYEFGCKVSVVRGAYSGVITGMKSFTGNPYDGHTLAASLDQSQRIREDAGGNRPKRAVGDRGYRGASQVGSTAVFIPSRGSKDQSYYEKQKQRKRFRRRAGIEPVIGHLKSDHRMLRNYLAGELGDAVNCLLAGAAFNLKMRLNQLRASFGLILSIALAVLQLNRTMGTEISGNMAGSISPTC